MDNVGLILANAMQAQANKPQKTSSFTTTDQTSTPVEYADMLKRRDSIGQDRLNFLNALKMKEGFGYNLANSLAGLQAPQTNDTPAGILNFARGFGGAFNGRQNAAIDNAKMAYETGHQDRAAALDFDKAMGTNQRQTQSEQIGYNEGGAGAGAKSAANAYSDLDPTLPERLRKSQGFSYMAREADAAARNPGSTGPVGRAWSSIARATVPAGVTADRQGLIQEVSNIVRDVIASAREMGSTGQMMNSDNEGRRALAVMADPGEYTGEELAKAVEIYYKFKDRELAAKGMPSLEEGYNAISKIIGQDNNSNDWSKYKDK